MLVLLLKKNNLQHSSDLSPACAVTSSLVNKILSYNISPEYEFGIFINNLNILAFSSQGTVDYFLSEGMLSLQFFILSNPFQVLVHLFTLTESCFDHPVNSTTNYCCGILFSLYYICLCSTCLTM